jgi:hypothetical protein
MPSLSDFLDLPEEVTKSAFVVRLIEAVHRPDELMKSYAVTADIHDALDRGLGLISNAINEGRNDAAFVHGSFGSGKSHFMAVLSLLAGNAPRPWSEPKLHDLLAKHEWVKTKKLLRLHINLIDAPTLGDKLFGSYIDEVRKLHPDSSVPPLFANEALFSNAEATRERLGDEPFFAELNRGTKVDSRWGKGAAEVWSRARFDEARSSADPKLRASLFSALVKTHFPAFLQQTSTYLPFEQGMVELTRHAKGLGYDAVVLLLDELVLWLATKAGNREALQTEMGKFGKVAEGQADDQAVPIISFAASVSCGIAPLPARKRLRRASSLSAKLSGNSRRRSGRIATTRCDLRSLAWANSACRSFSRAFRTGSSTSSSLSRSIGAGVRWRLLKGAKQTAVPARQPLEWPQSPSQTPRHVL